MTSTAHADGRATAADTLGLAFELTSRNTSWILWLSKATYTDSDRVDQRSGLAWAFDLGEGRLRGRLTFGAGVTAAKPGQGSDVLSNLFFAEIAAGLAWRATTSTLCIKRPAQPR